MLNYAIFLVLNFIDNKRKIKHVKHINLLITLPFQNKTIKKQTILKVYNKQVYNQVKAAYEKHK